MPKPACLRSPRWTRAESTALVMLYEAGWSWPAIAAHVSGIYGHRRTYRACQSRGNYLGILRAERQGHQPLSVDGEDLEDLMILNRSTREIARELGVSTGWVQVAMRTRIAPQRFQAWRQGEYERRSASNRRRRRA